MHELFAVKISLGSVAAAQNRISQSLAEPVRALREFVERQSVCFIDETTWSEQDRQPWLWAATTGKATVFRILSGRSRKDAGTIIGNNAAGIVTTDRYPGYNWLPAHHRQICWAHLKRDFRAISERGENSTIIGEGLLRHTKEVFDLWRRVRDGTLSDAEFWKLVEPTKEKVNQLLIEGTASTHSKTRNTCSNILKLEYSLWTFTRVEGVEPTNNQVERALRRAVMWRRKSFGTQSESGSRFVERILSVVATLKQQGRSVFDYLCRVCRQPQTVQAVNELALA